jgi:hypothetical protein
MEYTHFKQVYTQPAKYARTLANQLHPTTASDDSHKKTTEQRTTQNHGKNVY